MNYIEIFDGRDENFIDFKSDYNKDFISQIKKIGGKWTGTSWTVDFSRRVELNELLKKYFNEDLLEIFENIHDRKLLTRVSYTQREMHKEGKTREERVSFIQNEIKELITENKYKKYEGGSIAKYISSIGEGLTLKYLELETERYEK